MIGLCGAHRTGKTTLAQEYSRGASIPFVRTSTSEVFKALGFDPKMDYDFKIRMFIQNKILDAAEALWSQYEGEWITDRTPIDMLAYTMADVQRENLDTDDEKLFESYHKRCIESSNKHFSMLIAVQPGIPMVETEGKAPSNIGYVEHINSLVLGLVHDSRVKTSRFLMSRATLDLNERCAAVDSAMDRMWDRHQNAINSGNITIH